MSWRASTNATVSQLASMNCAIGNANDHITIAEKQVRLETTTPGRGVIKESALLDMAPDLSKQCSAAVCANASLRYNARIISVSIVKYQQFVSSG
jgi:hypothetical protein